MPARYRTRRAPTPATATGSPCGRSRDDRVPWRPMSRRIEIELTSARSDGTWNWRAAGAREPKGVLEGSLLPEGSKIGSILKADTEVELDGITVLSVSS